MSIPDPIVLLDARAKYVHPAFQMTRASTKTVFDSTGKLVTVPANALGWDHDSATGQARGYLAEPGATNLLQHSNDLTQPAWSKSSAIITPDAITGPDGNGMAKLVEDSSNSGHHVRQPFTITAGQNGAVSIIAKAGERTQIRLYLQRSSNASVACFADANLSDGTITNTGAAAGATIVNSGVEDLGGGFCRVWLAGNLGSGITDAQAQARLLDDNGATAYQGDGTSGLYLGKLQVEPGAYPTSYIETGAATATRAGDSLVLPGLGDFPWWRSERGTMLVDVDVPIRQSSGEFLSVDGSSLSVRWVSGQSLIMPAGITDGGITLLTDDAVGRHRIAISWDDATLAGVVDGEVKNTRNVIGSIPSSPALGLGCNSGAFNQTHGCIHRAVYYPARISNADLQSLTAIQE